MALHDVSAPERAAAFSHQKGSVAQRAHPIGQLQSSRRGELPDFSWPAFSHDVRPERPERLSDAGHREGDIVKVQVMGGTEGVLFLTNLYHDSGKPIVPLNLPLCPESTGARRLYNFGLTSHQTRRLFQFAEDGGAHRWLNRIRFSGPPGDRRARRRTAGVARTPAGRLQYAC